MENGTFMVAVENSSEAMASEINVSSSEEPFIPVSRPTQSYAMTTTIYTMVAIGLLTNLWSFSILRRFPETTMFIYLKTLSVLDFLYCCSMVSTSRLQTVGYFYSRIYNLIHTYPGTLLMHAAPCASLWITATVAIDRAIHVHFPLKAQQVMTHGRARIIATVVCVSTVLINLPFMWLYEPKHGELEPGVLVYWYSWSRYMFSPLSLYYLYVHSTLYQYIIPVIFLICNPIIIFGLVRSRRIRRQLISQDQINDRLIKKQKAEDRVIILLLAVCLLSIICNVPLSLTRFIFSGSPGAGAFWKSVTNALYTFDRCSNFFVYCVTNAEFRREMANQSREIVALVCCKKPSPDDLQRQQRVPSSSQPVSPPVHHDKNVASQKLPPPVV